MLRSRWLQRLPWAMVVAALALVVLGCLAIERSAQIAGSGDKFLVRQMVWAVICLAAMLVVSAPSYRILSRYSYAAFGLALVLLVAVYFFPPINGARRWIRLGPLGIQPSELAKLAFVLALARYLMTARNYRTISGLLAPLGLTMVPALLVLREPDLGTAMVFVPVLFAMLYAAGARVAHLALVVVAATALLPVMWSQMSREQKSRISALADQTRPGERPSDDAYHLHQARAAMALGSWWGSASTDDEHVDAARYILPESHTDSVSVVIAERFGLAGWAALYLLYGFLAARGLAIAAQTREPFGRVAAVGIVALLITQVLINTGMHVGLLPITGLPLPLVSYGGSSLLANCLGLGLLINIAIRPGYEVANEPFAVA